MRRMLMVIAAGMASQSRPTEACSGAPCVRGYIVPATGSTVPANIPALYWRSIYGRAKLDDLALLTLATTTDPSTHLSFTTTTLVSSSMYRTDALVVPEQALVEGTSYVLADANDCADWHVHGPTSTFTVGPAAPPPAQLGTLTIGGPEYGDLVVSTGSGTCDAPVQAVHAIITLALSADAMPWRDALHFETYVDGVRWYYADSLLATSPPGSSGIGRGLDLVFTVCHRDDVATDPGLAAGMHVVTMRATLPGSDVMIETPPASVQLDCPPPPIDADVTEVGTPAESGCGCETTDARAAGPLVLALFGLRRRRRAA